MRRSIHALTACLMVLAVAGCDSSSSKREDDSLTVVMRAQKICQLVGDFDKHLGVFTQNQTGVQANLFGTDMGVPFTHGDRIYLLFGDSHTGHDSDDDAIVYTTDLNPDDGIDLTVIQDLDQIYHAVQIPGVSRGAYEVPVEGFSLNGNMYLFFTTDWSDNLQTMRRTVLARSVDEGITFQFLYNFSCARFMNVSAVMVDAADWPGLPHDSGTGLLIFGTGLYRQSPLYLAWLPSGSVETAGSTWFFCGSQALGQPRWTHEEGQSVPLFSGSGMGEISVEFYPAIGKWVLLYNHLSPRGILMRSANVPWESWSEEKVVFDPWTDSGYCYFMHAAWQHTRCDSVHDTGRENEWGGEYGPYQFGTLSRVNGNILTLYFTMSTWNPYTVVLMKAELQKND